VDEDEKEAPAEADSAAPAVPGDEDKFKQLCDLLKQPLKSPKDQVADGKVPAPTNVSLASTAPVSASSELADRLGKMDAALQAMCALSQIYSDIARVADGALVYKLSVSEEARKGFAADADYANKVTHTALSGLLSIADEQTRTYDEKADAAELHMGILTSLFHGFNCSEQGLKDLDGILTDLTKSLSTISVSACSENTTIDQFLRVTSIKPENMGTKENPVMMYHPYMTCFYIKVKKGSWETQMSKWSGGGSVSHQDFHMEFTEMSCRLDYDLYVANKDKLDKIANLVVGDNLETYGSKLCKGVKN
jgi:hypothetical protein